MIGIKVFQTKGELEFFAGSMSLGRCSIEKFNMAYGQTAGSLTGEVLPVAVRYMGDSQDGGKIILLEDKPQYRMFQFTEEHQENLALDGTSKRSFYLPFPWMQLMIRISSSNVVEEIRGFFSQEPFRTQSPERNASKHYPIPMHNWYDDGKLCRPQYSGSGYDDEAGDSIFSILNSVQNELWGSGYNNDLYQTVFNYFDWWCERWDNDDPVKPTIFDCMEPDDWKSLREGNDIRFFLRYYSAWAALSMDEILKIKWQTSRGCHLDGVVRDASPSPTIEMTSWPALNARILGAAQTASMM